MFSRFTTDAGAVVGDAIIKAISGPKYWRSCVLVDAFHRRLCQSLLATPHSNAFSTIVPGIERDVNLLSHLYPNHPLLVELRNALQLNDYNSGSGTPSLLISRKVESCPYEHQHIQDRLRKLSTNEKSRDDCKTWGIGWSGGGLRAALVCFATVDYLVKTKRLDCISHWSGVSGAAWALAAIHSSHLPPQLFIDSRKPTSISLGDSLLHETLLSQGRGLGISNRQTDDDWLSIWGRSICRTLGIALDTKWSETIGTRPMQQAQWPWPLLPVVDDRRRTLISNLPHGNTSANVVEWYELAPIETMRLSTLDALPTWSLCNYQELPLSDVVGLAGSVMSANVDDLIKRIRTSWQSGDKSSSPSKFIDILSTLLEASTPSWQGSWLPAGRPFHWNCVQSTSGMNDDTLLYWVDAGLDFNLAVPPLLVPHRKLQNLLLIDCSATDKDRPLKHLYAAAQHAVKLNRPFIQPESIIGIEHSYRGLESFHIVFESNMIQTQSPANGSIERFINTPRIVYIREQSRFSTLQVNYSASEVEEINQRIAASLAAAYPLME